MNEIVEIRPENANSTRVFASNSDTPQWATASSLSLDLSGWEAHRDSGIKPNFVSSIDGSVVNREEALEGFRLLRLNRPRYEIKPQQLVIADVLGAIKEDGSPLHSFVSLLAPRRTSKTTSAIAVALGRCATREGYQVGFTLATTRDKAAVRFKKDIAMVLERLYPDKANRPMNIRKSNGSEWLVWPSGSMFQVITPSAEGFRSEAFDMIIIDEAGEASPELSEDLLLGALATMDTRPEAQFVLAGTAPDYRAGNLLWDGLERGRNNEPGAGIVEYSAYDPARQITAEELSRWELAEALAIAAHPGIGTLTTLETVRDRHRQLKPASFARDYLSIAGMGAKAGGLFDLETWAMSAIKLKSAPRPPEYFSIGIAVHPDQISASIVAAWRVRGKARVLVLENKPGVAWLADRATTLSLRYKTPLVHDSRTGDQVLVEVAKMERLRPRPKLQPAKFRDVLQGVGLFMSELKNNNLQHFDQDELNAGVEATIKRPASGGTAFGRREATDDITTVEAAALALNAYDNKPKKIVIPTSMTG